MTAASAATAPPTETRTFLIADIRGYTVYTREHGDEAAASLATRFAELVAEIVAAREGFLLEVRGDEALVVFVSARKALRAAIDLQARFAEAELPRGVGIGLDCGRGDPHQGRLSRDRTEPRRAAVRPGGPRRDPRLGGGHPSGREGGRHQLRRCPVAQAEGLRRAVRAVAVVPSEKAKGRRPASGRGSKSGRRRWLGARGAGVAAVAVVGGASPAGSSDGSAGPGAAAHRVGGPRQPRRPPRRPRAGDGTFALADLPLLAFYDAAPGRSTATAPDAVADACRGLCRRLVLAGPQRSASRSTRSTRSRRRVAIRSEIRSPRSWRFAFSKEALWFTDHERARRRPSWTGHRSCPRPSRSGGRGRPCPGGRHRRRRRSVWFSRPDAPRDRPDGPDDRSDPCEDQDVDAFTMDFGNGAVWYTADGRVGRSRPRDGHGRTPTDHRGPGQRPHRTWRSPGDSSGSSEPSGGVMYKLDRTPVVDTIASAPGIDTPSATSDTVWVANNRNGTMTGSTSPRVSLGRSTPGTRP